jgi:LytS/YehU family sensor histidine kinase
VSFFSNFFHGQLGLPLLEAIWKVLVVAGLYAVFIYLNLQWGIPKLLLKQRYTFFAVFIIGITLLCGLLQTWIFEVLNRVGSPIIRDGNNAYWISVANSATMIFITSSLKIIKNSLEQQQKNRELTTENLQTELKFLKTQVNPHFLFNTLNNLYALTLTKSDQAPEIVIKLSSILRYMLYECNEKLVFLNKEIEYLRNYIELEELRMGGQDYIRFHVEGNADRRMLAPLLFTPLLENAIKHGLNRSTDDSWVHIDMKIDGDELEFVIENSKSDKMATVPIKSDGGIGLINVRRRLELLYPQKHVFRVSERQDTYRVYLKLTLEE